MDKLISRIKANPLVSALLLLVILVVAFFALTSGAHAQNTTVGNATRTSNVRHMGSLAATGGQTFATTSYADLVGTTLTFTPSRSPTATGPTPPTAPTVRMRVSYSMDVSKATATTGSCAVYANGAVIAASERFTSSAAVRNTIGGVIQVALTGNGSQVVKLQCRSGDTNVFTVTNATVTYDEIY